MSTLKRTTEAFLRISKKYFFSRYIRALAEEQLRQNEEDHVEDPGPLERAIRSTNNLYSERKAALRIGRKLAVELEAAGEDSRPLLAFLHAIDCGGGPEAAAPLWGPLKVDLQRIAIRAGISRPAEERRRTELEVEPADSTAGETAAQEADSLKSSVDAKLAAVLDDVDAQIIGVAGSQETADERMQQILQLDRRSAGWTSIRWSELLGVSGAAIRQTRTWISLHSKSTE